MKGYAEDSPDLSKTLFTDNRFQEGTIANEFEKAAKFAFDWLNTTYNDNTLKDFGDIFKKYHQN